MEIFFKRKVKKCIHLEVIYSQIYMTFRCVKLSNGLEIPRIQMMVLNQVEI